MKLVSGFSRLLARQERQQSRPQTSQNRMDLLLLRKQNSNLSSNSNISRMSAGVSLPSVRDEEDVSCEAQSSPRFRELHASWHAQAFKFRSEDNENARGPFRRYIPERPQPACQRVRMLAAGRQRVSYELVPLTETDAEENLDADASPAFEVRKFATKFLESALLQGTVAALIIANAVCMGFETDDPNNQELWDKIEHMLLLIFFAELSMRIAFVKCFFDINSSDFFWNMFDIFLVTAGTIDFVLGEFYKGSAVGKLAHSGHSTGVATVFRVFRILRVLRVIRLVRFLKQLYILSYGFLLAAEAVLWVSVIMAAFLYVCSIVLVRSLADLTEHDDSGFWQYHYGSIADSMFTLFQLMVEPDLQSYRSKLFDRPVFTGFLVMFIVFGSFGMIALLTGVISEAMFQKNQVRLEEERQDREGNRTILLTGCQSIFDSFVTDPNDEVSRDDVRLMFPQITELFDSLHVRYTAHDLDDIIDLMDTDGSERISKSEFCRCLIHIAENSEDLRPMLMMELHYDSMRFLRSKLADYEGRLNQSLKEQRQDRAGLREDINQVLRRLESSSIFPTQGTQVTQGCPGSPVGGFRPWQQPQIAEDVRALQGQMFALAARLDDLMSDVASERNDNHMRELTARRQCMEQESALAPRIDRLEHGLRQLQTAVSEMAADIRTLRSKA
eukprot:CAMPEP_0117473490 /NCGR_PEP_ID=MMETSP0784-20121206/8798_1 /TAXON_ID=39447 /ORGANISM="" /LENGTH=671 /DNA_ID=CAMNT_0005267691 /DNA_START=128 /DNA_END=2143 /DNA_ORIENTATION=+